jgi:hypothetical protein
MGKQELDNLVKIQRLKAESPTRSEYTGMVVSARKRLVDAQRDDLDPDSRFDLAYGAAHRLALAALRREGYRSEDRITVFQTLVHTLGTDRAHIQTFLKAHNERNLAEYEGGWKSTPSFWLICCGRQRLWRLKSSSWHRPLRIEVAGKLLAAMFGLWLTKDDNNVFTQIVESLVFDPCHCRSM